MYFHCAAELPGNRSCAWVFRRSFASILVAIAPSKTQGMNPREARMASLWASSYGQSAAFAGAMAAVANSIATIAVFTSFSLCLGTIARWLVVPSAHQVLLNRANYLSVRAAPAHRGNLLRIRVGRQIRGCTGRRASKLPLTGAVARARKGQYRSRNGHRS